MILTCDMVAEMLDLSIIAISTTSSTGTMITSTILRFPTRYPRPPTRAVKGVQVRLDM